MEFLETHGCNNIKTTWRNDIDVTAAATEKFNGVNFEDDAEESENEEEEKKEKIADKIISDLEVRCVN